MHKFVGTVESFNGRYWKKADVKVKASSFHQAARLSAMQAPHDKGKRIEQIVVKLTRIPNTTQETDNGRENVQEHEGLHRSNFRDADPVPRD